MDLTRKPILYSKATNEAPWGQSNPITNPITLDFTIRIVSYINYIQFQYIISYIQFQYIILAHYAEAHS